MRRTREASSRRVASVTKLRRWLQLVSGTCSCLVAPFVLAQSASDAAALNEPLPSRTVRITHDSHEPPRLVVLAVTRLSAELRVAGFSVISSAASDAAGPTIQDRAAETYADISVGMLADQLRLDISSRSLGASGHVVLLGRERELGLLALQATEFLRAGLVPRAQLARARTPRANSPPAPAPLRVAEPHGRWLLDGGAALLTNWGTGDRLPLLAFGAGYEWPQGVSLLASLDAPLHDASFETARGGADYRAWLVGARADYRLLEWSTGALNLGLCAGGAEISSEGRPLPPLEPLRASSWAAYLGASLATEYRLTRVFAVTGQARVVSLSPNPLVSIVDQERRIGSPALLFGVGARLAL
jgi:hypothetical protein